MPFSVIRMFPVGVVKTNIGRPFTEEELGVVEYHKTRTLQNSGNVYSAETRILDKELADIKQFINYGIEAYVQSIIAPKSDNLEFYITQSWLNYSLPGQFHHRHPHPNSIISGSFYFNADPKYDNILFHKELYEPISIEPSTQNMFNTRKHSVEVATGDLVIFPSNLEHSVPNTKSTEMRISLAFNVFAKGDFHPTDSLSQLTL